MRRKFVDVFWIVLIVLLIVFTLFISYQAVRKIVGGSWEIEDLILGFLMAIVGLLFGVIANLSKLNSDVYHLRGQVFCLGKDFKEHMVRFY